MYSKNLVLLCVILSKIPSNDGRSLLKNGMKFHLGSTHLCVHIFVFFYHIYNIVLTFIHSQGEINEKTSFDRRAYVSTKVPISMHSRKNTHF